MRLPKSILSCLLVLCMLVTNISGGRIIVAEDLTDDSQVAVDTLVSEEIAEPAPEDNAGEEVVVTPATEEVVAEEPAEEVKEEVPEEVPAETPEVLPEETPAEETPTEEAAPAEEAAAPGEETAVPVEETPAEEIPAEEVTPEEEVTEPAEEIPVEEEVVAEPASYEVALEEVTVTAVVPAGTFAEDVEFVVTPLAEGTPEYEAAKEAVEAEGAVFDGMLAFDIYFKGLTSGEKIQPDGNKVSIGMKLNNPSLEVLKAEEVEVDTLTVTHIGEEKVEVVADMQNEAPGELQVAVDAGQINALEATFDVEGFSTFVVTWRQNNQNRQATIHYGYMNGNNFVEFDTNPTPAKDDDTEAYLIYDFDGYQYSGYTYYRTNTTTGDPATNGTRAMAMLRYTNNRWRYHDYGTTYNNNNWNEMANNSHVYVIYEAKPEATSGGTAKPTLLPDQQEPAEPDILKGSVDNGDGTRTLSLSITGHTEPLLVDKLADVIVIFDVSGSMGDPMSGSTRLQVAKNAVNNLATQLYAKKNSSGQSLIRMSLISFSTAAQVVQGLTDNETTFKSAVSALTDDGGTNWEHALQLANQMAVDPDRATFVIFVSDGDPTFRKSRMGVADAGMDVNNTYYISNSVYGAGNNDNGGHNYDAALVVAKEIVQKGKSFYTIGISNDVSNMAKLNNEAGGKGNYTATSSAELETAFNEILESISGTLGWTAGISDGITGLTNLSAKTAIVGVDESSFKYYKNNVEWDPASEGANEATYNSTTGAVEWNLGENFQMDDGVTYKVTFTVWPSQQAIDYVTQLNNHEIEFADLPAEVQKQIQETAPGSGTYTLKTNTEDAYVTYQPSVKVGDTVTVTGDPVKEYFNEVNPLGLDTMTLKVKKLFNDTLTDGEDRETQVTLFLQRRVVNGDGTFGEWEDFAVPYINPDGATVHSNQIVLSDKNNWEAEFYISPGLETDHEGTVVVYNPGYEFRLTEPSIDYHYELNSEIVKPMLVNMEHQYIGDDNSDQSLSAENIVKGGIDVKKILLDMEGNEITDDQEFTFIGSILDANGNPYTWAEGDDVNASGAYHKFVPSPQGTFTFDDIGYGTKYERTVYKGHFASTANIEFTLKPGEFIRFINVPQGSTFQFSEAANEAPYVFEKIEGKNQWKETGTSPFIDYEVQPEVSGDTVSGTVYGNVQHTVTVTNKVETTEINVTKVWENADGSDTAPEGATVSFTLYRNGQTTGRSVVLDGTADEVDTEDETSFGEFEAWKATWKDLAKGDGIEYTVIETVTYPNYAVSYPNNGTSAKDGESITNRQEVTSITVTKVWDDNDNQDGYRVAATAFNANITLLANGTAYTATPTITDNNDGTYTITYESLPRFNENEEEITYTVQETTVPANYTVSPETAVGNGGTITNKHTPETVDIVVTKVWDDNSDQDGYRVPAEDFKENVVLLSGTEELDAVPEIVDNGDNTYTITYSGLPKKANGTDIVYSVKETTVPANYEIVGEDTAKNGGEITNQHTPEVTSITVTKIWVDNNNQDGYRVAATAFNANITLLADGTAYTATPTITDNGDNTYTITYSNLPKKANGTDIAYTVQETDVPANYTVSPTTAVADGGEITNTHTPEVTSITVTKVWDDNNNQDGYRVAATAFNANITLLADGTAYTATPTITDNGDNTYTITYSNLPKKANGTDIAYTVQETDVPANYTVSPETPVGNNGEITNTHTPETVNVTVTKVWEDNDNQDGLRQDVVLSIFAGETDLQDNKTIAKDATGEALTVSWTNLPKKANGTDIEYSVKEAEIDGYDTTITPVKDNDGNYTITVTNSHDKLTTEVTVTKAFDDAGNEDFRPENIAVQLSADGTPVGEAVNLNKGNQWTYTWPNLDAFSNGSEIVYTVDEVAVPNGYTKVSVEKTGDQENGYQVVITNKIVPTQVVVTKEWDDNNDQDGKRPESVVFQLYANDTAVDGKKVTLDGTTDENGETAAWVATFANLPQYDSKGVAISYTVKELDATGAALANNAALDDYYTVTYENGADAAVDQGTITNTHEPLKTSVKATKVWDDEDDQDGKRDDVNATVQLYANGQPVGEPVSVTTADDWSKLWENLPVYADGEAIVYTVVETPSEASEYEDPAYDVESITADEVVLSGTIQITNSYTPETTKVKVTKTWSDANNQDGKRASVNATVQLYKTVDGTKTAVGEPVSVTTADDWSKVWENLPVYEGGKQITYSVEETLPEGSEYTKSGDTTTLPAVKDDSGTVAITNSYTPEVKNLTVTKVWDDKGFEDYRPESITVVLKADDTAVGEPVTLGPENWTYTWEDLNVYKVGAVGQKVTYTVEEDPAVEGYEAETTDVTENEETGDYEVTITNTPITTEYVVEKEWEDENNFFQLRPTEITVVLEGYAVKEEASETTEPAEGEQEPAEPAEGEATEEAAEEKPLITIEVKITPDKDGKWSYTFEKLPTSIKGTLVEYSVKEIEVDGYKTEYGDVEETETGSKLIITNTLKTIDLNVTKKINAYAEFAVPRQNITFVFKVEIKGADGSVKYTGTLGVTIKSGEIEGTNTLRKIPYTEGDTVTVTEIYSAGYTQEGGVVELDPTMEGEEIIALNYEVTNTVSKITPPPYGSGVINDYVKGEYTTTPGEAGSEKTEPTPAGN